MSACDKATVNQSNLVCRGCLKEWGEMKNMYQWGLDVDFFKYTNIPRQPSDGLPELLCGSCEADLVKTKTFKNTCQQSDRILKSNLMNNKNALSTNTTAQVTSTLENNTVILKITAPNTEEKIKLTCPYEDCSSVFIKKQQLHTHLKQMHDADSDIEIEQQYYCTETDCVYNKNSDIKKYFTGRKFLNQHFKKRHMDKNFVCNSCGTMFASESDYLRHLRTCNIMFFCPLCNNTYATNEAYLVHLMRKHPKLHAKYKRDKKHLKRSSDDNSSIDLPIKNTRLSNLFENAIARPLIGAPAKIIPLRTGIPEVTNRKVSILKVTPGITNEIVPASYDIPEFTNQVVIQDDTPDNTESIAAIKDMSAGIINNNIILKQEDSSNIPPNVIQQNGIPVIANEIIPSAKTNTETVSDVSTQLDNVPKELESKEILWDMNDVFETTQEQYTIEEEIAYEEVVNEEENVSQNSESLKKTSWTQIPEDLSTDMSFNPWSNKSDFMIQTDEISTQTVFEDLLMMKSQQSVDEIFFSESVSLSDIQTQTLPDDVLSRCHKETQAKHPDLSIKETQTCLCLYDSSNFRLFDSLSSGNFISTETQTLDSRCPVRSDVLLSFSSAETQTCFDDSNDGPM